MAAVELAYWKVHFCATQVHMYAKMHQSMFFGIQFIQLRRHIILFLKHFSQLLIPSPNSLTYMQYISIRKLLYYEVIFSYRSA